MKLRNTLLAIKVISLAVIGLIVFTGNLGLSVIGGLWACPFPIPFIMCGVCPVYCVFGQIRLGLFYGMLGSGLVMGRVFCGVFCPFGVAQELVSKIPVPKVIVPQSLARALRYFKYVLALLVLALVIEATGVWTGLPLVGKVWPFLSEHTGGMRIIRLVSIPLFLIVGLFVVRAWCRYLCPVGTWISPFNRFSLVGLKHDPEKCVTCGICDQKCSRHSAGDGDEDIWNSPECVRCLQCYTECQGKAFELKNRLRGGKEENGYKALEI